MKMPSLQALRLVSGICVDWIAVATHFAIDLRVPEELTKLWSLIGVHSRRDALDRPSGRSASPSLSFGNKVAIEDSGIKW